MDVVVVVEVVEQIVVARAKLAAKTLAVAHVVLLAIPLVLHNVLVVRLELLNNLI